MKFYKNNNYIEKIKINKLNAVYISYTIISNVYVYNIKFFKDGILGNYKNSAFVCYNKKNNKFYEQFWINSCFYGDSQMFSKTTWRNFSKSLKLKAFL